MGIFDLFKPNVEKLKRKKDTKGLIKAMGYNNYTIQTNAINALVELNKLAIEPLIQALYDKDSNIQKNAIEALGEIGEIAVTPLIQAIKNEKWDPWALTHIGKPADALVKIGKPAVEPLIQILRNKGNRNGHVRESAAWALGEIGDAVAVEPLIEVIREEGNAIVLSDVYWKSHCALSRMGEIALEPLIRALKDENKYVRGAVAYALGEIGNARAEEPLIKALEDKDREVREGAEEALKKIKAKKS